MANPYESDRFLAEYLLFHYGADDEIMPWGFGPRDALGFPERTAAAFGLAGVPPHGAGRALDLGCAVGRSAFAMARRFDEVIGLDYSHRFIDAANALKNGGEIPYDRLDEGGLTTRLSARCPEPALASRVSFVQGDAMHLPHDWENFDGVHAANLLCRLPEPMKLVARLPGLVRRGGVLVLATPCTWLEDFTPRAGWLGGFVENGRPVRTIDRLRDLLADDFEEVIARDEPLLIREHERKFQWSVAQLSVWRRR